MQHWTPDETATPIAAPADSWAAWLNRMPDHETVPDRPARISPGAIGLMAGIACFWGGAAFMVWSAIN